VGEVDTDGLTVIRAYGKLTSNDVELDTVGDGHFIAPRANGELTLAAGEIEDMAATLGYILGKTEPGLSGPGFRDKSNFSRKKLTCAASGVGVVVNAQINEALAGHPYGNSDKG
jgi:hypothetical protein